MRELSSGNRYALFIQMSLAAVAERFAGQVWFAGALVVVRRGQGRFGQSFQFDEELAAKKNAR